MHLTQFKGHSRTHILENWTNSEPGTKIIHIFGRFWVLYIICPSESIINLAVRFLRIDAHLKIQHYLSSSGFNMFVSKAPDLQYFFNDIYM